jgi:hypothetical protein
MRTIAAAPALLLGMLFNHAASAIPISTTTVNFSPTVGSSFTFQWQDSAKCNPADATCFVTSIDWTNPRGINWTNVSEITSFSATFVADALTDWALSFQRVTPVVSTSATYERVDYAGVGGSGFQSASSNVQNFRCLVGPCGLPGSGGGPGGVATEWSYSSSSSVPEPATVALLGLGLVGVGMSRKRQT